MTAGPARPGPDTWTDTCVLASVGALAPGRALSLPVTPRWGHVRVYPQERRSGFQEP